MAPTSFFVDSSYEPGGAGGRGDVPALACADALDLRAPRRGLILRPASRAGLRSICIPLPSACNLAQTAPVVSTALVPVSRAGVAAPPPRLAGDDQLAVLPASYVCGKRCRGAEAVQGPGLALPRRSP